MAISYPLNTPTTIGIESIELRAMNAVAISQSPLAADWKAMLVALKGSVGTFLLGDPDYATPRGTVSGTPTLSGTAGDSTVSVTMTGTLLAGDYIQLGTGSAARLHQVLVDQSGSGNLEIWPDLRSTYSGETVIYSSPKGVFRLGNNTTSWSIDNASFYGISFDAIEALQ
jgi:hypothetical protein